MNKIGENCLTITPAEGFNAVPPNLLDSILNKNGEVDFSIAVPLMNLRASKLGGYDPAIDRRWGCLGNQSTEAVNVADEKVVIFFSTRYGNAINYVPKLSALFPDAVFHLNYIWMETWGGELTARAGKVLHKVEDEGKGTPERARSVNHPSMDAEDYIRMEVSSQYIRMLGDKKTSWNDELIHLRRIIETEGMEINPERSEEVVEWAQKELTCRETEYDESGRRIQ